jgi:predicted nucleic acid-binding protein
VLLPALTDAGRDGESARRRLLAEPELHAPHHLDLEVVSGLKRGLHRRLLDQERADEAVLDLGSLAIRRYPFTAFLERIWSLRDAVSTYDAPYVALAEALDIPLVTFDRRLAAARGLRCAIEVVG